MFRRDEVKDIAVNQQGTTGAGGGTYYRPSHYGLPLLGHSSAPQSSSRPAISSCGSFYFSAAIGIRGYIPDPRLILYEDQLRSPGLSLLQISAGVERAGWRLPCRLPKIVSTSGAAMMLCQERAVPCITTDQASAGCMEELDQERLSCLA